MKALLAISLAAASSLVLADNYTNGYFRNDGTYVQPHYQTAPNQYKFDNYSSQGNVNPYTGQAGTQRHEYSNPPAYNNSFTGSSPYNQPAYQVRPYGR